MNTACCSVCGTLEEVGCGCYRTYVRCPVCRNGTYTDKVEFLDCSEDPRGYDEMTFVCPNCKNTVQSLVRRGNPS